MTKHEQLKKNKTGTDPMDQSTENTTAIVESKAVTSKRKSPMKNLSPNKKKKAFNLVSPDLHQKKQEHVLENAGIVCGLWDFKEIEKISVECKQLNDLCNLHEEYKSLSMGDFVLHKDKYLVFKIMNKVDVVIINALLKETIFDSPTLRGLNTTKKEEIMKTFNIPPSRKIGIIKNAIREAILDGVIENDYQQAMDFMKEKAEALGIKNNSKGEDV